MPIKINGTNTAANPSITGSDTDTGIVYGSDQIDFSIGGTSKATIDSSGRVGIGTASPSSYNSSFDDLVIEGPSNQGITIATTNTSSLCQIGFADGTSGDAAYRGLIRYDHSSDHFAFYTAGLNERMRIDSSGKVGIGTTSPSYTSHFVGANETTFDHVGTIGLQGTDNYDSGNAGAGITFNGKYNSSANVTTFAQISGIKENTADGEYDGALTFGVRNDTQGVSIERMRIDSSGRLLLGTTTEGEATGDDLTIANSGDCGITIRSGTSSKAKLLFSDGTSGDAEYRGNIQYDHNGDYMKFSTAAAERMRIVNDGRVRIVCESFASDPSSSNKGVMLGSTNTGSVFSSGSATNTQTHIIFRNGNGDVGTIQTSGSSTAYNTSSDYRLKENAVAISDGITRLKTLKPYRFNFKADADTIVDGFFAHEVTAVPEAISGTKDEVALADDEVKNLKKGDPVYQGIDQSKIVPLLTAALQEAVGKIETLETKVAALEAA